MHRRLRRYSVSALLALVALFSPVSGIAQAAQPERQEAAIVVSLEVTQDERGARLRLLLSRPVDARSFLMEGPDRIVIDMPNVNFQIAPKDAPILSKRGEGIIGAYRYGAIVTGRSRIVIELRQPALVTKLESVSRPAGEAADLVIELRRASRAEFAAAASRAAPVAERPARGVEPTAGDSRPTVVIDAGHGGIDPGAVGARGAHEKHIVLTFAQRLRQKLEEGGRYRVVMTRDSDVFVSLGDRVRIARESRGDLFISIHADTLSVAPEVRGLTVYTGSERASDAEAALLADKENRADAAAGVEQPELLEEVAGILADLTLRETRVFSQKAAQQVIADLASAMRLNKNPLRSAGFRVLRAPDVPSVLIELGYLSSAEDVALLQSKEWRDRATGSLAAAVHRYFAGRVAGADRASFSP